MGLISVKTDCFFYSIINSWFAENIEIYVSWGAVYAETSKMQKSLPFPQCFRILSALSFSEEFPEMRMKQ